MIRRVWLYGALLSVVLFVLFATVTMGSHNRADRRDVFYLIWDPRGGGSASSRW